MPADLHLRLYIAGDTIQDRITIETIRKACIRYWSGHYKLDVVDIKKDPAIAVRDQIFAIPTLIRLSDDPEYQYSRRLFIGSLTSVDTVARMLDRDQTT